MLGLTVRPQPTKGAVMFTFKLIQPDGTPADPPTFVSSEPNWRVGNRVLIRPGFEYRIVGIEQPPDDVHGVWIVEPVPTGH
jgi:hypothetical protein